MRYFVQSFIVCLFSIYVKAQYEENESEIVFLQRNEPSTVHLNAAHGPTVITANHHGDGEMVSLNLLPVQKIRHSKKAVAIMKGDKFNGVLRFYQPSPPLGATEIYGNLTGLEKETLYDVKIHRLGNLALNYCLGAGKVYDPYSILLDWRYMIDRRVGDIGRIQTDENGNANIDRVDIFVHLTGSRSVIGRMISLFPVQEDFQEITITGVTSTCGIIGHSE